MARHILTGQGAPNFTPERVGMHYVDTANRKHYLSVGTSGPSDWQEIGGGGLTQPVGGPYAPPVAANEGATFDQAANGYYVPWDVEQRPIALFTLDDTTSPPWSRIDLVPPSQEGGWRGWGYLILGSMKTVSFRLSPQRLPPNAYLHIEVDGTKFSETGSNVISNALATSVGLRVLLDLFMLRWNQDYLYAWLRITTV